MNTVNINGKTYTAPDGVSISVINNKVYFDGELQENLNEIKEKKIEIIVKGNCNEVKADTANITIEGNVDGNVTSDTGNIKIRGDVKGNVSNDCGNISAHHIFGNASNDCGNINGISSCKSKSNNTMIACNNWFSNVVQKIFD